LNVSKFTVKISLENSPSINLFKSLQFQEVSISSYFQEVTLELIINEKSRDFILNEISNVEYLTYE